MSRMLVNSVKKQQFGSLHLKITTLKDNGRDTCGDKFLTLLLICLYSAGFKQLWFLLPNVHTKERAWLDTADRTLERFLVAVEP